MSPYHQLGQRRVVHSTTVAELATLPGMRDNYSGNLHGKRTMDHEPTPIQLSALLKQLREAAELSLYELAKRIGINRSTLLRIEGGATTQPDNRSLNMLARVLGVDPELLYDAAWWQDTTTPLPSPRVYFRSKYHLSAEQIRDIELSIKRIAEQSATAENNDET